MKKLSFRFFPKTRLGIWSLGLIVAMPILFFLGTTFANSFYASVPAGKTILADIAARPALVLSMLAGMAAGTAAFITGILAIFKSKDHALLVYAATVVGAALIVFLAGEFISPH